MVCLVTVNVNPRQERYMAIFGVPGDISTPLFGRSVKVLARCPIDHESLADQSERTGMSIGTLFHVSLS